MLKSDSRANGSCVTTDVFQLWRMALQLYEICTIVLAPRKSFVLRKTDASFPNAIYFKHSSQFSSQFFTISNIAKTLKLLKSYMLQLFWYCILAYNIRPRLAQRRLISGEFYQQLVPLYMISKLNWSKNWRFQEQTTTAAIYDSGNL